MSFDIKLTIHGAKTIGLGADLLDDTANDYYLVYKQHSVYFPSSHSLNDKEMVLQKVDTDSKIKCFLYLKNRVVSGVLVGKCKLKVNKLKLGKAKVIELDFDNACLQVECLLYSPINYSTLPSDMLSNIFSFIEDDDQDSLNFQLVNREYYKAAHSYRYQQVEIPNLGLYTLFQGAPNQFYLELPNAENNFSMYKVPYRKPWGYYDSDIVTRWYKLRIDPKTLMINTGDFRFSKSKGQCHHHHWNTTTVPYATCFGCERDHYDDGRAKCDITGTPFKFNVQFIHCGWNSMGTWNFSHNEQVIDITGGGFCGWTSPALATEEKQAVDGGWFVQLQVIDFN